MVVQWKSQRISLSEEEIENFDVNDESFSEAKSFRYYTFYSDKSGYVINEDDERIDFTWGVVDDKLSTQRTNYSSRVYTILKYSKNVVLLEFYYDYRTRYYKLVRLD